MTLGHLLTILGACLVLAGAAAAPASARPTAVVAFLDDPRPFDAVAAREELALGVLGATQGPYARRQALLDLGAGNRVSRSGYEPREVPPFTVRGRRVTRWADVVARARSAPTDIAPGALGAAVPGGAAYAGPGDALEAVVAADRRGRIGLGAVGADPARAALTVTVVDAAGLDRLLEARPRDRLVVVIARPPDGEEARMLPVGAAGLGSGLLTSRTTRRRGLVAGTDVARTVLTWLRVPVPEAVRGRPITAAGERDAAWVRDLERRLRVVSPRRFPVLLWTLAALVAAGGAMAAAGRGRTAARVCALAVLWIPVVALLTAALAPSRTGEIAAMALGTPALGALTDRLVPWPRGPAVPALGGVLAYAVDLALGSELIVRSLLGPNPRFGSRFYGVGNELEATLPVLALVGLAAVAGARPRSRGLAAVFGGAMLALGVVVGAGRLGADVGGVITIGAAAAAAVVLLLPGGVSRRALTLALAVPVAAVLALAALDLVTGGDAHFSTTVLGADDPGDVADTIGRRYELAFDALLRGLMPLAAAVAAVLAVLAVWRRRTLYAPVAGAPAWGAALGGGLVGAVAGTLSNDSGPVLLVIGVLLLGVATLYVRGRPAGGARTTPGRAAPRTEADPAGV